MDKKGRGFLTDPAFEKKANQFNIYRDSGLLKHKELSVCYTATAINGSS